MSTNGVVEIFIKSKEGKSKVGVTFLDEDSDVSYINKIFLEAMMEFVTASDDPIKVAEYDLEVIQTRMNNFKSEFINPSGSIIARLDSILAYIKNNKNIYEGIKVYV